MRAAAGFGTDRVTSNGPRPRVLIVDDHEVVRSGLRLVFETLSDFEVCGEADSIRSALEAARTLQPDLVLLDLTLGDSDGRTLIPPLRDLTEAPRVLVVSMRDERIWGRLVMADGADGFVAKSEAPETLIAAATAVLGGSQWVRGRAIELEATALSRTPTAADLSQREHEILEGIAAGRSAKEIAQRLGVAPATIDSHKRNIRVKLGIGSMAELLVWAEALRKPAGPA